MSAVQAAPSKSDSPPTMAASERLALSRERLRQALRGNTAAPGVARSQRGAGGAGVVWLNGLKSLPGAGVVIEALISWWAQHPLRLASRLALDTVKAAVQPMAQRSPLGLILGAAVVGGLLLRFRPWRWIPKSVLFAGLLPQLLSKVLAHVQPVSWLALTSTLVQHLNRPKEEAAPRKPPNL